MALNIKTDDQSGDVYFTSYLSYVALLTQNDEDAPTAIVLNSADSNFIGNIVWSRINEGNYLGTLAGAFSNGQSKVFIKTSSANGCDSGEWSSNDAVLVNTLRPDTRTQSDGYLYFSPIEIRVYP